MCGVGTMIDPSDVSIKCKGDCATSAIRKMCSLVITSAEKHAEKITGRMLLTTLL